MRESTSVNAMLSEVDNLIRNVIPCFAEAVGLRPHAEKFRKLECIQNASAIQAATQVLRNFSKCSPGVERDFLWMDSIQNVAFWAEASVWTAAENNRVDCLMCVFYVKRELDSVFSSFIEH